MGSVKHQARESGMQQVAIESAAARRPEVRHSDAGPLLAGAWARGVADTLDMLGQGAVLLDCSGGVLFASPLALQRLDGAFVLVSGHLVAHDSASNCVLQEMISAALAGTAGEMPFPSASGERRIRALPAKQVQDPQMQLLKAFLTVE